MKLITKAGTYHPIHASTARIIQELLRELVCRQGIGIEDRGRIYEIKIHNDGMLHEKIDDNRKRGNPGKHCLPWSPLEYMLLAEMARKNEPIAVMATELQRTIGSVLQQLSKLQIIREDYALQIKKIMSKKGNITAQEIGGGSLPPLEATCICIPRDFDERPQRFDMNALHCEKIWVAQDVPGVTAGTWGEEFTDPSES